MTIVCVKRCYFVSRNGKNTFLALIMNFHGQYESTIDTKGRFLLPAGLRKQLPDGETRFVISRGFEKCLTLYTIKEWETVVAKMSQLNEFDANARKFRRLFMGGATEVELDAAGRMLLPQPLKEHVGLQKDIVLTADINKFEIWDESEYKQYINQLDADEYSALGTQVMSNLSSSNNTNNI